MTNPHPSYFQLDRFVAGADVDRAVRDHASSCPACAAYVRALQTPETLPDWLPSVEHAALKAAMSPPLKAPGGSARRYSSRSSFRPPRRVWRTRVAAGLVIAATAAAVMLLPDTAGPPSSGGPQSGFSTVRGAPSVGLYVKRGTRVWLWDGEQPVAPNDELRLKVVPEGFRHVAVFTIEPKSGALILTYSGPVEPARENLLPSAWRVDGEDVDEHLVIALAHDRAEAERINSPPSNQRPQSSSSLWLRALHLRKVTGNAR